MWITVAAVVVLAMVGALAVLGSTLNERLRMAAQVGTDVEVDPDAEASGHRG